MMGQVILNIKDNKLNFFLELIKNFDFVSVADQEDSKEKVKANLAQGFEELKQYKNGKLKTTSAKDFINEL